MTRNKPFGKQYKWLAALTLGLALCVVAEQASAQEILLTGPLAGAPSVRKMRLYRRGRFEIAPTISFTLLDEYQRQMFVGARLNYNITDWLALGVWGGLSPDGFPFKNPTGLVDKIQAVNAQRIQADGGIAGAAYSTDRRLTAINMGPNFADQLGSIDWIAAPQLTLVPLRGKIAFFQNLYADTDFYFFGGPAFVGVTERADCAAGSANPCVANGPQGLPEQGAAPFLMKGRSTIAPTFGLGFTFYLNKFLSLALEWRALPFSRNVGGFDNRGRDPDARFPDRKINSDDREFKFNQMFTVGVGVALPLQYKISE
ncbi:MAG TPA: hypothetical protein VL137_16335 [Polyangiaceae bacterium]|nr:hypothetical protein [Polyangiaceae bacterium]